MIPGLDRLRIINIYYSSTASNVKHKPLVNFYIDIIVRMDNLFHLRKKQRFF